MTQREKIETEEVGEGCTARWRIAVEELEERHVWRRCGAGGRCGACHRSEGPDGWGKRRQGPLLGEASWEPVRRSRRSGGRDLDRMPRRQLLGEHAPIMLVALRRQRCNLHQQTWWETWKAGDSQGRPSSFAAFWRIFRRPNLVVGAEEPVGQGQGEVRRSAAAVLLRVPSRNVQRTLAAASLGRRRGWGRGRGSVVATKEQRGARHGVRRSWEGSYPAALTTLAVVRVLGVAGQAIAATIGLLGRPSASKGLVAETVSLHAAFCLDGEFVGRYPRVGIRRLHESGSDLGCLAPEGLDAYEDQVSSSTAIRHLAVQPSPTSSVSVFSRCVTAHPVQ